MALLVMPDALKAQVNISGVINTNTAVTGVSQPNCSDCDADCKDTIEVNDASTFSAGDRALIIQMKGATINTANTSAGGQITDIGTAGNYEFFIVDSVDYTNDIIFPVYGLIKSYSASDQAQVIRIPNYGKNTVTVTDTLTAPTWLESTGVGGVVALVAEKLVLNADINVIGKGFKGNTMTTNGTPDNCSVNPNTAYTLASTASQSYTKGEGIVADNTSTNRGRAPRANGGGSGISGDSGGGGGSSYGAGGRGGFRWCDELGNQDGGPDIPAGGLGGVELATYFPEDRLFLGGAGGSGFVTTNNPSDATDGGGIVILFVDTLVGNGYSILADGTTPVVVNPVGAPDGGGGGGGGGTVLLNVEVITDTLTVTCNGGNGQDLNTNNYHGPGGGGGGGVLLYSLPSLPSYVTFSADGGRPGEHLNGFTNGADSGEVGGTFGLYVPIENVNYRANVDGDDVAGVCDIDDDNDGIPDIQEIYVGDHDGDGILDYADDDFCNDVFDGVDGWDCTANGLPNPTGDMDDDGYPNFFDADFPYCGNFVLGIDEICSNFDPDGDGIPSHFDLDSDNDGIPDIVEAGGADTNGNGQSDAFADSDGDGLIDLYDADDTDGPLGSSPCVNAPACLDTFSFTTHAVPDSDNDTIPDFLDTDSDNDGIPDVVEAGGADENGDGRLDGFTDSDDDGLSDIIDAEICEEDVFFTNASGTYESGLSTGITNGNNATGTPDGSFAQVYDPGDDLVLDFDTLLPTGSTYYLVWRRKASYGSGPTADMVVEESADGASYSTNSVTPQDATQQFVTTTMTTETPTRYIRLSTLTGSNDDFDFDAAYVQSFTVDTTCVYNAPLFYTGPDANTDGVPDSYVVGDYDGDGVLDFIDLDTDNDGIPDVVEAGGTDADGDGRADDYIDADNDGFNDIVDGDPTNALVLGDDGAGTNTANALHVTGADTDNDGVPNSLVSDDMDGDGIPNFLDADSDDDGISDVLESGGTDANSDARIDGGGSPDTDGDGFYDVVDGDVGNDGTAENTASALVATGADTDNDGAPNSYPNANGDTDLRYNAIDIDADNDGITDNTEAMATASYAAPSGTDTDGDGLDNSYDPDNGGTYVVPNDLDSDGTEDFLDEDSDDDTYPDIVEGHDTDGNGIADAGSPANTGLNPDSLDTDNDGLYDGWDNNTSSTDPTNSGLDPSDHPDVHNPGGDRDWRDNKDTDNDGVSDFLDLDDDNDGVTDIDESGGNDPDGNEDGDAFPNWIDTLDNGNGGDGSVTDYVDSNGDGIPDVYDFDGDGVPNHLDKDSDNDGVVDIFEAGGTDNNEDGEVDYPTPGVASTMVDTDNDGLADALDDVGGSVTNGTPLPQTNTDGAGGTDMFDIDSDDDGIVDNTEAQATSAYISPSGSDTDMDGIDNAYDPDNGGTYITPVNTEGTGNADYRDGDSDDDGEADTVEGHDSDGDGTADAGSPANTGVSGGATDTDGDGLLDGWDNNTSSRDPTNGGLSPSSHPNEDVGNTERDWREVPCSGGSIALPADNTVVTTTDYCIEGDWTYYYNSGNPNQLLFAIERMPSGGNTNDFTATVTLTNSINPDTEPGVYSNTDIGNARGTFVMGRYWNVNITSGSLNGAVNIRYYYDPNDADTMEAVAERWNDQFSGGTSFVSGRRWFAMNSGTFDHTSGDLIPQGIVGATEIFPNTSDFEDGIDYVQFNGLTSLTGGGHAFSVGVNSIILPVELYSFEAEVVGNDVLLEWRTESEINSDYFEVERWSKSHPLESVGTLQAAGNSNERRYYSLIDKDPIQDVSYYRLKMVDYDGSFEYSAERTVSFGKASGTLEESIYVYPNPNDGNFVISWDGLAAGTVIELHNAVGQLVDRWSVTEASRTEVALSDLNSGTYLVRIIGQYETATKPVIVH